MVTCLLSLMPIALLWTKRLPRPWQASEDSIGQSLVSKHAVLRMHRPFSRDRSLGTRHYVGTRRRLFRERSRTIACRPTRKTVRLVAEINYRCSVRLGD